MEKVLNQEEIDAMFRAVRGREGAAPAKQAQKILPCNFRQAGQINSEQVRSISALHEGFARNLTHWLAAYLRTSFECNLVSVEQIPYREVLSRIPEVAYLATFRLNPMDAVGALQLDLALAFPIIDMLLGGGGKSAAPVRDVTEIEEQILEGVVKIICRELQTAWQPLGLEFVFDQRQQPSQMQRLMAPAEMTLCLSFEIKMADTHGTLNLVFPSVVSNALLRKLAREWAYQRPHASEDARKRLVQRLMNSSFSVELGLIHVRVRMDELLSLTPGTLLPLRRTADSAATVLVGGQEMFRATPARQLGMRAGQVQAIVPKIESPIAEIA
jgi:flagellar motor switch protein FliM